MDRRGGDGAGAGGVTGGLVCKTLLGRGIEDMEDMMAERTALVVCNGTLH